MAMSCSSVGGSASGARLVEIFCSAVRQVKESSILKLVTKRNVEVLKDLEALEMHLQKKAVLDLVGKLASDMQGIVARLPHGKMKLASLWRMFHAYRQGKLVLLWGKLGDVLAREFDAYTIQNVSERMLVSLLPRPEM